jgi:SAM-dependent methyltransferase
VLCGGGEILRNMITLPFISEKLGQFTYFAQQVGETVWRGKNVLDFGGNIGNILRDPNCTIDEERYWCIDVVKESVERGRALYPGAHWLFYDRSCFFFNPHGVPGLPLPKLDEKFDYIVAYSVFTNTPPSDMHDLLGQLQGLLKKHGTLAFTFIDPSYVSWPGRCRWNNFRWRLEREIESEKAKGRNLEIDKMGMMRKTRDARWLMLVNGEDLYVETEAIRDYEPEKQRKCNVFHTEAYMRSLLPQATILPPANDEMQHCCLIRNV